jgi:hypothetical protein
VVGKFEYRRASFDLSSLVGCAVEDAAARCTEDGFTVRVVDLDVSTAMTADLVSYRVNLMMSKGIVVKVSQG